MNPALLQALSLGGACACLIAYGKTPGWRRYRACNAAGALALLVVALIRRDLGFVLLNASWLAITVSRRMSGDEDVSAT